MNIKHNKTGLVRAGNVAIPEEFFSRLKTGAAKLDKIFGEGILPGMTITISADPGCGKTTLMLQLCQALADQNFTAAYVSGEESQEMVAYTCSRLQSDDVLIACENNLDRICDIMKDVDFLVIDSFQSLTTDADLRGARLEQHKIDTIVGAAKQYKTAVAFVLHSTKGGQYKGGTGIVHAVDCNIRIEADSDNVRNIDVDKNRYGYAGSHTLFFGSCGYDFEANVVAASTTPRSKSSNKDAQLNAIMQITEPPAINVQRVCNELNIDAMRANYLLRDLVAQNKLQKFGRGENAVWKFTKVSQLQSVEMSA